MPLLVGSSADFHERLCPESISKLRATAHSTIGLVSARLPAATEVSPLSLLDDVAFGVQSQSLGTDRWRSELFTAISQASVEAVIGRGNVYRESHFLARARELQAVINARLSELGIELSSQAEAKVSTNQGDVRIKVSGFNGVLDMSYPSCAVFDLAWSEWRLTKFGRVFTVLPAGFRSQQLATATLAALTELPGRERLVTLLTDVSDSSRIVEELAYYDLEINPTRR